jgi:hypothetical protein
MCRIMNFLFNAIAVKEFLIFSGCYFVLTAIAMHYTDELVRPAGCPGMIPLELAFTKGAFMDIVNQCGEKGVRSLIILNWIDYLFLVGYIGFMANLLGALVKGLERGTAVKLFSIPIIAGVLGAIANTIFIFKLADPVNAGGAAIFLASAASTAKLVLTAITVLLIAYYLYAAVTKRNQTASS